MTFASRGQHLIYWGPLKKPLEWSLKTFLAPWSYIASVVYHDTFWYTFVAKKRMEEALRSEWGRLFCNWEKLEPDERGYPDVGEEVPTFDRAGLHSFLQSFRILATCLREAPELEARRRRAALRRS
jgi:hypothetical protein